MSRDRCRLCSRDTELEVLRAKDFFLGTKEVFKYLLCESCNSLFIAKVPKNLADFYKNYYSFGSPRKLSRTKKRLYKALLGKNKVLKKVVAPMLKEQEDLPFKTLSFLDININADILDVGCGSGELLAKLFDLGYTNCVGIDPFLEKSTSLIDSPNLYKQSLDDHQGTYDVVMFHHVLEHFIDIRTPLEATKRLLRNNGICIVRLPDIDSYSFRRYKENWFSIHAPFHLTLPSREVFVKLVEEIGMKVERQFGEQLPEFILYSKGHELGVSDYDKLGNRRHFESHGLKNPPLHTRWEVRCAKDRSKHVQNHDICDWVVYIIRKEDS